MENEQKTFTQEEVNKMLENQKEELRKETVWFIAEKSSDIAEKKAKELALVIAEQYKDLSIEEKQFEQDKKQLEFYVQQWALPSDMTLWKMMINRQLWRELWLSLIQTINWIAFVNWRPSVYWETYLALITKNWYKINVLQEEDECVEIELDWPNGKQKWKFTKQDAEKAWLWKNVFLKHPKRMLRYKAIRNAQNILCPEIMWWAYLYEEAQEVQSQEAKVLPSDDDLESRLSWFEEAQEWETKNIS